MSGSLKPIRYLRFRLLYSSSSSATFFPSIRQKRIRYRWLGCRRSTYCLLKSTARNRYNPKQNSWLSRVTIRRVATAKNATYNGRRFQRCVVVEVVRIWDLFRYPFTFVVRIIDHRWFPFTFEFGIVDHRRTPRAAARSFFTNRILDHWWFPFAVHFIIPNEIQFCNSIVRHFAAEQRVFTSPQVSPLPHLESLKVRLLAIRPVWKRSGREFHWARLRSSRQAWRHLDREF